MDAETLMQLRAAVGSTLSTEGPTKLDATSVNRLLETFGLPGVSDGDPVHSPLLGHLPRGWCDLSEDTRPAAPFGLPLGRGVNGGVRLTTTGGPVRVGESVTVTATLDAVEVKQGRRGQLVLVTISRVVRVRDEEHARFLRTTIYTTGTPATTPGAEAIPASGLRRSGVHQ